MNSFILLLLPILVIGLPVFDDNAAYELLNSQDRDGISIYMDESPEIEEKPICRVGSRCSTYCMCPGKCLVGRFSLHRTCFF